MGCKEPEMPNTPRLTWCCHQTAPDSLDVVILVCKLLVVEAELIRKVGRHLLDLVLGEGLEGIPKNPSLGCPDTSQKQSVESMETAPPGKQ